jgi:hypothetical protein
MPDKNLELTVSGQKLSAAAEKRVRAALKKTLEAELKKAGATLGGVGGRTALDVSGHGRG